jgi:[ribosomal protein S5]-alanine N-acetyltransferase
MTRGCTARRRAAAPISTARLELRPFEAGDLAPLRRILSDPPLQDVTPEEPRAIAAAERAEAGNRRRSSSAYEFAVVVKRTGRVAGACELIIGPRQSGEIGYLLGRRHWGHGYATEIARALVIYGLDALNLRHMHATVALDNPRSRRVLQKAGFVWDALIRHRARSAGPSLDSERYVYVGDTPDLPACRPRRSRRS